jgi:hypothetical protein
VLGSTLCVPALAQWKWLDTNGNAQYSDRPPPNGTPDSKILQRPNANSRAVVVTSPAASAPGVAASAAAAPALKASEPELEAKRKKVEDDKAAKAKVDAERQAKLRAENCTRAKSQAAGLDQGLRVARVNEKGEREILDDQQRADESSRARAIIASDCK